MNKKKIPYGYCHCGCGQKTKLHTETRPSKGYVKGEPRKYIIGHARRTPGAPLYDSEKTEYEAKIDALIPKAMRIARRKVREKKHEHRPGFDWVTWYFHNEMNRMAFEAGLRGWK